MTDKILINCANCHKSVRVPTDRGAIEGKCPHCYAKFLWTPYMLKECPNCGYIRQAKDNDGVIPLTECPGCRTMYKKIEEDLEERIQKEKEMRREIEERKLKEQHEKYFKALKQEGKIDSGLDKMEINELDKAKCHYKWGNNAFDEGLYECAIDEFTQAINFHPLYIEAYTQRSLTYSKLKKHVEAKADMKAATRYREIGKQEERYRKAPEERKAAEIAEQFKPKAKLGFFKTIAVKTAVKKSLLDITDRMNRYPDLSTKEKVEMFVRVAGMTNELPFCEHWEGTFSLLVVGQTRGQLTTLSNFNDYMPIILELTSDWINRVLGGKSENLYAEIIKLASAS